MLLSANAKSAPEIEDAAVACDEGVVDCDEDDLDFDEALDEVEVDVQGSLDDVDERLSIRVNGDLRLGYIFAGEDFLDVAFGETDLLRARWRLRSTGASARGCAPGPALPGSARPMIAVRSSYCNRRYRPQAVSKTAR